MNIFVNLPEKLTWFIIGLIAGWIIPKQYYKHFKCERLPKGKKHFFVDKGQLKEVSEIIVGDGKPTYWSDRSSIKNFEIVPKDFAYFEIAIHDGLGFCGKKTKKVWRYDNKLRKLSKLQKKLSEKYNAM